MKKIMLAYYIKWNIFWRYRRKNWVKSKYGIF